MKALFRLEITLFLAIIMHMSMYVYECVYTSVPMYIKGTYFALSALAGVLTGFSWTNYQRRYHE